MKISSTQLLAFFETAKCSNFTLAAQKLLITQSALSQRILKLEDELELTLILREKSGISLTESGKILFQHCIENEKLEEDTLFNLKNNDKEGLSGNLFLGGFSSFNRSMALNPLSKFFNNNPNINIKLISKELHELKYLLDKNFVDVVFSSEEFDELKYESIHLMSEENVLIQHKSKNSSKNKLNKYEKFIDHDEKDTTTKNFWLLQSGKTPKYRRIYVDDIYSLIDSVALGMGCAIAPRHLVKAKSIVIVNKYKSLMVPVYMVRKKQLYYSKLQKQFWSFFMDSFS